MAQINQSENQNSYSVWNLNNYLITQRGYRKSEIGKIANRIDNIESEKEERYNWRCHMRSTKGIQKKRLEGKISV